MTFALASMGLVAIVGQNFFPYVDAGQMRLHVRPPTGTRIEEAAVIFSSIESEIRRVIPAQEIDSILDNIGLPNSGINLAFSDTHHQRQRRRRHTDFTEAESSSDARLYEEASEQAGGAISGRELLFPGGRYHQRDSQLRSAGSRGRSGDR